MQIFVARRPTKLFINYLIMLAYIYCWMKIITYFKASMYIIYKAKCVVLRD